MILNNPIVLGLMYVKSHCRRNANLHTDCVRCAMSSAYGRNEMKLWAVLVSLVTLTLIPNLVNTVTCFAIQGKGVLRGVTDAPVPAEPQARIRGATK